MKPEGEADNVRVVVRCRPLSEQEQQQGRSSVVNIDGLKNAISIANPSAPQVSSFYPPFSWIMLMIASMISVSLSSLCSFFRNPIGFLLLMLCLTKM